MSDAAYQTIRYEVIDPGETGIARITLDRPETRNAQNKRMTYELDAAYTMRPAQRREGDRARRRGPALLVGPRHARHREHAHFHQITTNGGFTREGQEGHFAWEDEVYFQMCWRWRNIPKPVVAAAQGKTIAGGLMLLWVADIIIVSRRRRSSSSRPSAWG